MGVDRNEVQGAAKDAKGRAKEKVGWATGDREVEAKGRVEKEEAATHTGEMDDGEVESLDQAEQEVRRANQEID